MDRQLGVEQLLRDLDRVARLISPRTSTRLLLWQAACYGGTVRRERSWCASSGSVGLLWV
jgi:hypothetical protein